MENNKNILKNENNGNIKNNNNIKNNMKNNMENKIKNNKKKDNFYVTTAIDYASGSPHMGHAYEKIAADVIARWNRNIGKNVFFQTGLDEHGQKIVECSNKINKTPNEFVNLISKQFLNLISKLNISNDYFIRTTNLEHEKIVQDMLQKSFDNGDIYKGKYEGYYCVGCERYYSKDELFEDLVCPFHKKKAEFKSEENYFFKLSKYQNKLLEFYKKNEEFISPKFKQKEILNRVKEGLNDISISRNKKSLNWGIELPFDKTHITYVWFDALFNYYSGLIINEKKEFWPPNLQIIGHDISWFHLVYWPAFLLSVGLELPKKIFSHGMILDENGHKMSKSLGNIIDPLKFSKKYGLDEMRYFLLSSGSFGEDICFSKKSFIEKINNELNNDLGNLISRIHTMTTKYFNGALPEIIEFSEDDEDFFFKLNIFDKFNQNMEELKFNQAIEILWTSIRDTNAYINKVEPWKVKNEKRLKTIINILVSSIKFFVNYLDCFIPEKTEKIRKQFNFKRDFNFNFQIITEKLKLGEKEILFNKINLDDEKFNENSVINLKNKNKNIEKNNIKNNNKNTTQNINKNKDKMEILNQGFSQMNLKIGKIISVKQHPDAENLYVEEIDLGEEKPRIIVSGLKKYYNKEDMINKKVIVLANLKPSKLRGIKSEGMVLVSENEKNKNDIKLGLLITDGEIGSNLICNNEIANSQKRIKIDNFFKFDFNSDGEKIYFENKEVLCENKSKYLKIDKNIKGIIC